jgi:hypothetical protein
MSRARDEEVTTPGIQPREHQIRMYGSNGRKKYPFKAMLVGDYFVITDPKQVESVRACLRSFYKTAPGRRFTVRQREIQVWVCRRVA